MSYYKCNPIPDAYEILLSEKIWQNPRRMEKLIKNLKFYIFSLLSLAYLLRLYTMSSHYTGISPSGKTPRLASPAGGEFESLDENLKHL